MGRVLVEGKARRLVALAEASEREGWSVSKEIFVFGSNLAGRHGKGAALYARQHHGAIYGVGIGMQGRSYAIPTKDESIRTLPLPRIAAYVENFIGYALSRPDLTFNLTAIGCGLAGYKPADIAPMFEGAPANVRKPPEFQQQEPTHANTTA